MFEKIDLFLYFFSGILMLIIGEWLVVYTVRYLIPNQLKIESFSILFSLKNF